MPNIKLEKNSNKLTNSKLKYFFILSLEISRNQINKLSDSSPI